MFATSEKGGFLPSGVGGPWDECMPLCSVEACHTPPGVRVGGYGAPPVLIAAGSDRVGPMGPERPPGPLVPHRVFLARGGVERPCEYGPGGIFYDRKAALDDGVLSPHRTPWPRPV